MTDETKPGISPLLLGGGFAAIIVVLALIFLPAPDTATTGQETAEPEAVADAIVAQTEEVLPESDLSEVADAAIEEIAPEPAPEIVTQDAPEVVTQDAPIVPEDVTPAPSVTAEAPALPQPQGPEFDTFRVETDGSMVIAGRADPGQVVEIVLGGQAIDRVTTDASGAFVALPLAGPSDQPRRLTLVADPDGAAIESLTSYIVAPIAAPIVVAEETPQPAESVAEAVTQGVEDTVAEVAQAAEEAATALEETVTAELTAAPTIETAPATAPTVLQTDTDGVRIVQGEQAEETDNVALDTITYDPEGDVQLSGRASTDEGAVQVYINNEPLAVAPITEEGDWRLDLPDIDTGVYTLRVDELDDEGTVVSRVETPFKREEPEDIAAVLAEETAQEGFEVAVRTVQPGSTLWAIAEETMGDGIMYVAVFEANRDLIRDPDLIYPGQIFRIPEASE